MLLSKNPLAYALELHLMGQGWDRNARDVVNAHILSGAWDILTSVQLLSIRDQKSNKVNSVLFLLAPGITACTLLVS